VAFREAPIDDPSGSDGTPQAAVQPPSQNAKYKSDKVKMADACAGSSQICLLTFVFCILTCFVWFLVTAKTALSLIVLLPVAMLVVLTTKTAP
jgi:hypothetical protein